MSWRLASVSDLTAWTAGPESLRLTSERTVRFEASDGEVSSYYTRDENV